LTSEVESTSTHPEAESDAPKTEDGGAPETGGSHSEPEVVAAPEAARPEPAAPRGPASKSKWRRFFLLEDEIESAEARAFLPGQPGFSEFVLARSALEAAQTLLDVPERRDAGLLLLRDALRLAMSARLMRRNLSVAAPDDSIRTLEGSESEVFSGAAPPDLEIVRRVWSRGDDTTVAGLTSDERDTWTRVLGAFVPRIVDASQREAELAALVRGRRTLRVGGVVALVVLLVGAAAVALTLAARHTNVALHKRVAQSSIYDAKRFPASGVVDGDTAKIGCHTKAELKPWIRIDLEQATEINEVVVYNRSDLANRPDFASRAVPLVIEVSTDGRTFRAFARKNDVFSVWHAKGTPVVARYVRLTIAKQSTLHFNEVQVF
jgi:hypothetical protein